MPHREPLSVIDAAWLRMDRPTNLMVINGMMMFAERMELGRLKEVVRTRMLCFHRFLQRIDDSGARPYWVPDPYFDLDWHVRHLATPAGATLEDVLSDLVSSPLDAAKPMWQFNLVDTADGGSAVVVRIHHCYGDGFALTHVINSMTDPAPDRPRLPAPDVVPEDTRSAWGRIVAPAGIAGDVLRAAESAMQAAMGLLAQPGHALDYGKTGFALVRDAVVIAAMTPDAPTRFKGPLGVMKRVAWAEPLSLFDVKAVGDAFGCSVNDVLLACVAGTLRTYLAQQGDAVDGIEMRGLIPVNCRPPGPIHSLGNDFGLVFLSLPIGVADPFERLLAVRREMEALKRSQQHTVALGILAGMGVVPEAVKERILDALAANASAVITNVRSAAEPQYLAGKRIGRQVFWVPQSGGLGMGISILSYAGKVDFGIVTDARRVPDPERLVSGFVEEFNLLLLCALLAAWPERAPAVPDAAESPLGLM